MLDYCNDLWPLIYDQYNHGRHEQELAFYSSELVSCSRPILEVACGTGMILLPLIERGLDAYGFDLSQEMLEVLYAKAGQKGMSGIHVRVSQQNMVDFQYEKQFEAIFIPARSFLHLPTQDEQIACLKNIHKHLRTEGRFMLNFFTPSPKALLSHTHPDPEFARFGTYKRPETKEKIEVSYRQVNDLSEQVQHITWRFEFVGESYETRMQLRCIYKNEFELLAKLAGLRVSALYSNFEKRPYRGEGEMVWVLEKDGTQPGAPVDADKRRH